MILQYHFLKYHIIFDMNAFHINLPLGDIFLIIHRESEGQFEYGNYRKEADDLHSVVLYFYQKSYDIAAVVGHSKGL